MAHPMGESKEGVLRVDFDRRVKLEFHGSNVTSEAGLLPYRELDDAVELTEMAGDVLADGRTGKNGRHGMIGPLRQSVFGRLAGYDDVNDADRPGRDAAMRWIVGGRATKGRAALAQPRPAPGADRAGRGRLDPGGPRGDPHRHPPRPATGAQALARLHQHRRERARHGAPGHPQRQTLEERRDGAQMDRRRPAGGPEDLPSPQSLSFSCLSSETLSRST